LTLEHLPAYSPELNPVEQLFKELRGGIEESSI
jgi:transposase